MVGLVFSGCRVDATVEVDVSGTGGTVTARFRLDREAVALLGGTVGGGAQTADLEQAGWDISPLEETPDGGVEMEASKDFRRASDLTIVIEELAGPAGPLREFRLDRERSFLKTRYRLRGTADLGETAGAATGFANTPDLPGRLRVAGIDPDRVEQLLAGRAAEGLDFRLVVAMPGRGEESWTVEPGAVQSVDVASAVSHRARPVLLGVAVMAGLVVVFRLRRSPAQT